MLMKTFQYKLYHSKRNRVLQNQIDIAGLIYNHCIALHKRYYRLYRKFLPMYQLQHHLTKLKKLPKFSFWNTVGSQAIQEITERIDKGYKRFFDYIKKKTSQKISPPGFKKVKRYKSFTLKQAGWALDGNRLRVGKHYYGFFDSRPIEGKVKTVTIKRDRCGDIFVFFACEIENQEILPMTGKIAGFDFGLKTFLTSREKDIDVPLFLKSSLRQLETKSRRLSFKEKGSQQRQKAKLSLSKLHRHIANQRRDHHFKLAKELCLEYDVMIFEDLHIKGMQAMWGRKISDLGFSDFMAILEGQATKYGKKIHFVDRFFASTKTCSRCHYKKSHIELRERTFCCENCGLIIPRDKNSAINIEGVGASTLGLDVVRPDFNAGKHCLSPESPTIIPSVH
jgi:putative transposase